MTAPSGETGSEIFRDAPRIFYFVNVPAVLVGVLFLLFAGAAFPALPAWWRLGVIPAAVVFTAVLTLVNIVRPRLVVADDAVTVVAPWTRHRFAWDDLDGWFVADQGGWCRVALVSRDGAVTVAPLPLDTRTESHSGGNGTVPGRLGPAASALDEAFAAHAREPIEATPEMRESGRRSAYRLVWTTLLVPANVLAVVIVGSFILGR